MRLIQLLMLLSFCAPMFISLISMGMMIARRDISTNTTKRRLLAFTIGYFFCIFISGITIILFIFEWQYYIYTSPLSFLALTLSIVFFYNILYIITSDNPRKKPTKLHYVIPFVITGIYVFWSLYVPNQIQQDLLINRVTNLVNYKWFSIVYNSKLAVYVIYEIIYIVLILKRMPLYRKYVTNFTADEEKTSLHWMYTMIVLTMIIIPMSFVTFFLKNREYFTYEIVAIIANVLYAIQIIILQYHIFTGHYIIISEDSNGINPDDTKRNQINRKEFEQYIKKNKPFLNRHLKITDLLYEFSTCRSYMSHFINNTYGMNFNRYINTLRMEEYKRLRNDPAYSEISDSELIIRAGFSNHRSYVRFRKNEEKMIKEKLESFE